MRFTDSKFWRVKFLIFMIYKLFISARSIRPYEQRLCEMFCCLFEKFPIISLPNAIRKSRCEYDLGNGPGCVSLYKIALCGLRWFKLNVSKCQKDVKLSKKCQVVKKMSNVKNSNT